MIGKVLVFDDDPAQLDVRCEKVTEVLAALVTGGELRLGADLPGIVEPCARRADVLWALADEPRAR